MTTSIQTALQTIATATDYIPYGLVSQGETRNLDALLSLVTTLPRVIDEPRALPICADALEYASKLPFENIPADVLYQMMSLIGALTVLKAILAAR